MKLKYTITMDVNPNQETTKEQDTLHKDCILEAFENRITEMFKQGWNQAEFHENIYFGVDGESEDGVTYFGVDGESEDGVTYSGWINLAKEIDPVE